ncbi:MAG: MBL fold metallo-hydrolase [Anaerolineae bacterium]|nr:MBL fold metallo-hydrolase [Anaerolineae bacterium]
MNRDRFTVTFWGVRGGYPTPGPTTVKYGGNTTCVEIEVGKHRLIIDGGTGIIPLGRKIMQEHFATGEPIYATILITHTHHDHTQGFPFFVPTRLPESYLNFFGPKLLFGEPFEEFLGRVMHPPVFPIGLEELYSKRCIEETGRGDTIILTDPHELAQHYALGDAIPDTPDDVVIIKVDHGYHHPKNGILFYRISYKGHSVVIATDTEGYIGVDRRLVKFAQAADLLIHDAEYDEHEYAEEAVLRQGWGHSTWGMAVDVARAAEVKQLALIHHSPQHDDAYLEGMVTKAQAIFSNTILACEGESVELL